MEQDLIPQLLRPTKRLRTVMLIFPNFLVNELGAKCIELCDGTRTLKQIIDAISAEYEVDKEIIERDVTLFFKELEELGLIRWKKG